MAGNASLKKAVMATNVAWVRDRLFPEAMAETETNLRGRLMNRRTGATLADVRKQSRMTKRPLGFRLTTTKPSLIAWQLGSQRKAFFVRPKNARALSWVSGGTRYFSRGHKIPPWKFSPKRPVFQDAVDRVFGPNWHRIVKHYDRELLRNVMDIRIQVKV